MPVERLDDVFTEHDHTMMGTKPGDPAGQSMFEGLAVLIAARTWIAKWRDHPTSLVVQSDSLAALGAAAKGGSKVAGLNVIMRELSLDLAEGEYEANLFGHIPGRLNEWADSLSRLHDPNLKKEVPEELRDVPRASLATRGPTWWRTATLPS